MQENNLEHNTNFHHIVPVKVYLATFIALGILTVITVAVAYVNLGVFNVPVALAIATLKATLVVLFFMHVRYSGKLVSTCIIAGIAMFILLIFGTLQDYWTRDKIRMEGLDRKAVVAPQGVVPATPVTTIPNPQH